MINLSISHFYFNLGWRRAVKLCLSNNYIQLEDEKTNNRKENEDEDENQLSILRLISCQNYFGLTPLHICFEMGFGRIIHLLLSKLNIDSSSIQTLNQSENMMINSSSSSTFSNCLSLENEFGLKWNERLRIRIMKKKQ